MKHGCENRGIDGICLRIFCALTASVTHEIKNTLSIINENAGLLEDLGSLAEEGAGIPAHYVDDAAKAVAKQVARSNAIMKNLNRFAHSGDRIPAQAKLADVLSLMVALTSRFAAMHKISATVSCPADLEIRTNLLVLKSLLFSTLCKSYPLCRENSVLQIQAFSDTEMHTVIKLLLEAESVLDSNQYPDQEEQMLAAAIGAVCRGEAGARIIDLPACSP